jgi:diaminopimelate epimerase
MELRFAKMNPTGNMTILVESPVPRENYSETASKLMAYGGVFAEQVGFIESPALSGARARLRMAGGEFCGNAAMSLAALIAFDEGRGGRIPLEISGSEGIVTCTVTPDSPRAKTARAEIDMPRALAVSAGRFEAEGRLFEAALVDFEGISHIILDAAPVEGDRRGFAERAIRRWNDELKRDALGIMLLSPAGNGGKDGSGAVRIEPLVFVPGPDTLVWEQGCGSGSAATGAYLAWKAGRPVETCVFQPGGCIKVRAAYENGALGAIAISGRVSLVARGTAY